MYLGLGSLIWELFVPTIITIQYNQAFVDFKTQVSWGHDTVWSVLGLIPLESKMRIGFESCCF